MKWTEGQQKVIDLRERNILVSAAAGSGKTAVLVERIIQKITNQDKPVDIDRLLVVTFTKAAAAEMRGRISEALEERAKENPKDENLQKQLRLLHNAQITTIDSFCQYIIRNYFPVIGLDPLFQVADETDLKLMKQDVLETLMEDHFEEARKDNNQAFLDFTEIFSPGRNDKPIDELILKLYTISQSYPQPEEQLKKWDQMYQISLVQELMETSWMQELMLDVREAVQGYAIMAAEAERICLEEGGPEVYLDTIRSDLRQINCLAEAEDYSALYEAMTTFNPGRLKAARGKEIDPEKRDLVKELRGSYLKNGVQKLQKELFFQTPDEMCRDIQAMASPVHELIQITLDFAEAFAAEKQDRGLIDFNDMEHFALRILVDIDDDGNSVPSAVARELQQHYEEILTDEYQDSNFVQETILTSLCRAPEQAPYLFMVGDVKQSIYQFRLARPDLFMQKYNCYQTEDSKMQRIDLHQNFRSRATVLESANYLFERLMREDFGGIVYDEAARLVPGAMFPDGDCRHAGVLEEGQTEILLVEQKSASEPKKHSSEGTVDNTDGVNVGDDGAELGKRALEAAVIGEKIRELVQGEQPLYVHDKGGYRPVEYRDIVILLRSLSGWSEEFIETLTDMGIPAYSATKTGYFATLEVETMLDFLRIMDNPRQDIPLVAVLRSCLFGITDEELAYLGTVCGTVNYWDAVCQIVAGTEQLQIPEDMREQLRTNLSVFTDRLKSYQELARTTSVYELLHKIYYETGYYSVMSAMPAGEKRAANLDILLQQAVEFADNGHRGIFEFCRYIESLRKSDIDFGEASIYGENTNAVQIMSIHKSKGLEFPVVFVAGMGKQFNLMDCNRSVIMDMDYGIGAEYMDLELRVKQPTLLHCFMKRHVRQSTLTEETRILYVALTRAKEKLYLTGTVSGLEKKMADWQQKGRFLNRMTLLSARTYLDWIMPTLAERTAYMRCMEEVVASQAGDSADADPLYRIRLQSPEEIVHGEAMGLMEDLLRKQELESWDDSIVCDAEMEELMKCYEGYCYPYQQEADVPVKISVSELKRRAMMQADALAEELEEANLQMMVAGCLGMSANEDRGVEIEMMGETDDLDVSEKLDRSTEIEMKGDSNSSKLSLQQDIPRPSFRKEQTGLSSAERGTLYHLVMEQLPYQDLVPGFDMDRLLNSLVRDGYMTAEEKDTLSVKRFTWFMQTKLGKRMQRAAKEGTLHREQQFMLGIPASEVIPELQSEEIVLIQGIIDAYFEEEGELVLVDYKTDYTERGQGEKLAERYRIQMMYYARALEQLTGKTVREKIIYSFSLGEEIMVM